MNGIEGVYMSISDIQTQDINMRAEIKHKQKESVTNV